MQARVFERQILYAKLRHINFILVGQQQYTMEGISGIVPRQIDTTTCEIAHRKAVQ